MFHIVFVEKVKLRTFRSGSYSELGRNRFILFNDEYEKTCLKDTTDIT